MKCFKLLLLIRIYVLFKLCGADMSAGHLHLHLPSCIHHFPARSRSGGYGGKLARRPGEDGVLTFKDREGSQPESLSIYLRLSPRMSFNGSEIIPFDVISASSFSLAVTLDHVTPSLAARTTLCVFVNAADPDILAALEDWTRYLFTNRTAILQIYRCPVGKSPSLDCMLDAVLEQAHSGALDGRTILYFVEDDYLHHNSATQEVVDIFSSYEPCLAAPYDYSDRYSLGPDFNADFGRVTLVAGKERHWRTVCSLTSTFAIRLETFILLFDSLPFPNPNFKGNDFKQSSGLCARGVSLLTPLPGLASHMESFSFVTAQTRLEHQDANEFSSLYFNWFAMGRNIVRYIKEDMKTNLWTLLGNPTFRIEANT